MTTMLKGSLALALALGVAGCATRMGPAQPGGRTSTSAIPYALARSYFAISVQENDDRNALMLELTGPYTETNPGMLYGLDLNHSGLASDRFEVLTNPRTGMLQTIAVASDSRINEIASAAGRLAGYGLGLSAEGSGGTNEQHGGSGETMIFNTRWPMMEAAAGADRERQRVEREVNEAIAQWYAARCVRPPPRPTTPPTRAASPAAPPPPPLCSPATAPRFTLEGSSMAPWRMQGFSAADCDRAICYSGPARATLRLGVVPPHVPDQYTAAYLPTTREVSSYVYNPATPGHIDPEHLGIGGGQSVLVFGDGALAYVAHARESEGETLVEAPLDFVIGVTQGLASAFPLRFWYVHERRQLGAAERGGEISQELRPAPTTPQAPPATPNASGPTPSAQLLLRGDTPGMQAVEAAVARMMSNQQVPETRMLLACVAESGACILPQRRDPAAGGHGAGTLPAEPTQQ